MPAAAIVAGSVVSGVLASKAAGKAASASQHATDQAVAEQQRQFDLVRGDTAHARQAGDQALTSLQSLYGLNGKPADQSIFKASPDYQFNLAEGQKAIDHSAVARGGLLSGAAVKGGIRYASGMASQQFGSFVDRLASIAGIGERGVSQSAGAGANAANNISNAYINNGAQRGSAYMTGAEGVNNAIQGGISNSLLQRYLGQGTTGGAGIQAVNYGGPPLWRRA